MCGKWQDLVANFIEFGHVETCSALAPHPNQFLSNVSIFNLFLSLLSQFTCNIQIEYFVDKLFLTHQLNLVHAFFVNMVIALQ